MTRKIEYNTAKVWNQEKKNTEGYNNYDGFHYLSIGVFK
jgi:hypothetical protein